MDQAASEPTATALSPAVSQANAGIGSGQIDGKNEKLVALVQYLDVKCNTPTEVIPHHILRRAKLAEIERFRGFPGVQDDFPFAFEATPTTTGSTTWNRSSNPEDWRYWVIGVGQDHPGLNDGLFEIQRAARLSPNEFRINFMFNPESDTRMSTRWIGQDMLRFADFFMRPLTPFDDGALVTLRDISKNTRRIKIGSQQSDHSHWKQIDRAIDKFHQLAALEKSQLMYLLGLFSVIEGLLTHDPSKGGYDSLTHQISSKMRLLERRFAAPPDRSPFGAMDFKKLWSNLYSLRSCIAHGSEPDFDKSLKGLGSYPVAVKFVEDAAKALLLQALLEPDLILDLQAC